MPHSCPVRLTHLFLWLTWAPLVARKRAAASFPAPAARCSKQFPGRKMGKFILLCAWKLCPQHLLLPPPGYGNTHQMHQLFQSALLMDRHRGRSGLEPVSTRVTPPSCSWETSRFQNSAVTTVMDGMVPLCQCGLNTM